MSDEDAARPHDLLAPNATALERALALASGARLGEIPDDVSRVARVAVADDLAEDLAPFLPWLAWSLSVDIWNENWPTRMQHDTVRQAIDQHRHRGTLRGVKDAIRRVLAEAIYPGRRHFDDLHELDGTFVVREWWQPKGEQAESGEPMTFEVTLWAGRDRQTGAGLTGELYDRLRRAIDAAKPMNTRYRLMAGGIDMQATVPPAMAVRVMEFARFRAVIDDAQSE